jgi:hypothetical protein
MSRDVLSLGVYEVKNWADTLTNQQKAYRQAVNSISTFAEIRTSLVPRYGFGKTARENAVKLCDTAGWGNLRVYFSPDDRHVIVRDGGSSMGIELRLFSRRNTNAPDEFKERENANIGDNAERFALERAGLGTDLVLRHRYVGCLWWSDDSKTILIHLTGSGNRGEEAYHMDWIGTYNVLNGEVSTDLASMNANAVTVWKRE